MSKDDTGVFGGGRGLWSAGDRRKERREPSAPEPPQPGEETPPLDDLEPPRLMIPANRVYVPFENRSRPESLIVFCAKLPAQFPAYAHFLNMSFDHHFGQTFTVFYAFMTVTVTGKRLAEIVHAINFRRCAIIREWHRDDYDPPERGVPVIEKIDIITPMESPPAMEDQGRAGH